MMKTLLRFLLVLVACLGCFNCRKVETKIETAGDVGFARRTFESLARGDAAVSDKIDWPTLTSMGVNAGAAYSAFASTVEKDQFATNFITQFSTSFRERGGSVDQFTNWRVIAHDSTRTEVAADSPSGVLTVIVSERDGVERVSSINIVK